MPKMWLSRMVEDQYNHPSIIGWSIGNEIGSLKRNPKVMEYVKGAIAQAKKLDGNRLAIYVSHTAQDQVTDPVEYSDMIFLNSYGNWGNAADKAWEKHHKIIFMSEFGHVLNNEDPNLAFLDADKMMESMRNKSYFIGTSLWTFNDYRSTYYGSEGWSTPPSQNRCWGIVTTFRQKKRAWYEMREQYAPVRDMRIDLASDISLNGQQMQTHVTITPRGKLDIPAYELTGYKIEWEALDINENVLNKDEQSLKNIVPGDSPINLILNWKAVETAAAFRVILRSPLGYNVAERTVYFKSPVAPEIRIVNSAQNGFRVVFTRVKLATGYVVEYGTDDFSMVSDTTIDNFIDLTDLNLKTDVAYQFRVRAVNGKGYSQPSDVVSATIDEDELPPVIWDVVSADKSGFIGYSVSPYDYLFEIEYGFSPGKYDQQFGLKTKGVCKIPNLENGKRVYLRMRSRKQWGFASEWTQEETFIPGQSATN